MEDLRTFFEKLKADIQAGRSDEEIYESLLSTLKKAPEAGEKLAEGLGTIPHEKSTRLLMRMLEDSDRKRVRKMIKRSLYRLKNRGIALEEVPRERERSILRPLQVEPQKGFGSGIDHVGNRLLLLVLPHAGRRTMVIQGVISDTRGLLDFSGEEMTRKEFRAFFEQIQGKSPLPVVEMEPSYVGFLFVQAHQLTLKRNETLPQEYLRLKGEVEVTQKEYERALIYTYVRAEEISGDEWLIRRGADLLESDLFLNWQIEEDQIQPYADAVREAEESKIVLNPAQREVRFQEIYLKAIFEIFSEEKRALYKRRLEEMAYVLFKLGRQDEARISLAVAIDLEKPVNPIQPNPFLLRWVVKAILSLLKDTDQRKEKEPSFIVKP